MGVIDAPQWLLPAYVRSVKAVGSSATPEEIRAAGERLVAMWSSPDRHFHGLRHAIDLLARVDELADESHNPDVMRLAAWYHGCVFSSSDEEIYRRNGGEDEVASAAYAAEELQALKVPDKTVDRVCALILNLKRHNLAPNDIDALALNDADLGTLAVEPQQYKRYRQLVRQEYAHIPAEDYLRARLTIVTKLLGRETLFSSPLGARWELPARQNLEAEQQRLRDALARLESADHPPMTAADVVEAHLAAKIARAAEEGERVAAQRADEAPAPAADEAARDAAVLEHAPAREVSGAPVGSERDRGTPGPPVRPFPAASRPVASPPSAPSGSSPAAAGPDAPVLPDVAPRSSANPWSGGADDDEPDHTTTLESCAAELDHWLSAPRSIRSAAAAAATLDRATLAQVERDKLTRRLQEKAQTAKELREARTGELPAITEETLLDRPSRARAGDPQRGDDPASPEETLPDEGGSAV